MNTAEQLRMALEQWRHERMLLDSKAIWTAGDHMLSRNLNARLIRTEKALADSCRVQAAEARR